jgi:hypothetical protein
MPLAHGFNSWWLSTSLRVAPGETPCAPPRVRRRQPIPAPPSASTALTGLLNLAELQRRHRSRSMLRVIVDPRHGTAVARRSVRLRAPMDCARAPGHPRRSRHSARPGLEEFRLGQPRDSSDRLAEHESKGCRHHPGIPPALPGPVSLKCRIPPELRGRHGAHGGARGEEAWSSLGGSRPVDLSL